MRVALNQTVCNVGLAVCSDKTFYAVRISISLAMLQEIFLQIGSFFSELCKKTIVDVFILNKVYELYDY